MPSPEARLVSTSTLGEQEEADTPSITYPTTGGRSCHLCVLILSTNPNPDCRAQHMSPLLLSLPLKPNSCGNQQAGLAPAGPAWTLSGSPPTHQPATAQSTPFPTMSQLQLCQLMSTMPFLLQRGGGPRQPAARAQINTRAGTARGTPHHMRCASAPPATLVPSHHQCKCGGRHARFASAPPSHLVPSDHQRKC